MRRGNTSRRPDKRETAVNAEARLLMYLSNVRPALRATITVDTILLTHAVPREVAEYRLNLAQQRWAAE